MYGKQNSSNSAIVTVTATCLRHITGKEVISWQYELWGLRLGYVSEKK